MRCEGNATVGGADLPAVACLWHHAHHFSNSKFFMAWFIMRSTFAMSALSRVGDYSVPDLFTKHFKDLPLYLIWKTSRDCSFSFRVIPFGPDWTFASWQSPSTTRIRFPEIISNKQRSLLMSLLSHKSSRVMRLSWCPLMSVAMLISHALETPVLSLLGLKTIPSKRRSEVEPVEWNASRYPSQNV